MQKIVVFIALLYVGTCSSVPVSKRASVVSLDETVPTEFLQKFHKAASHGGMLEPGAKVGAAKVNAMPPPVISSKTSPRSSNPTNPAKELSYKVIPDN